MISGNQAPLMNHLAIREYLLGGHGALTLENPETQKHFTFRIGRPRSAIPGDDEPYFVSLLNGPNNVEDYRYLGQFWEAGGQLRYSHGRKSPIGKEAPGAKAMAWFFHHLNEGSLPKNLAVYHEGTCCRCGRTLTTPESVAAGIGPVCAGRASS